MTVRRSTALTAGLVFFGILLPGCAPNEPTKPALPAPIGFWYGDDLRQSGDEHTRWLAQVREDGTYLSIIERLRGCVVAGTRRERGRWSVDGTTLTLTVTAVADPWPRIAYDLPGVAYEVVAIDEDSFDMRGLDIDRTFHVERVMGDIQFPPLASLPSCS